MTRRSGHTGSPFLSIDAAHRAGPGDRGPPARSLPSEPRGASVISSKNIEKLEHSAVRLTVEVPKEEVKREYEALLREYSRSVRIDGFRAGHVPTPVLERKFGEGLKLDAMGRVMEKAVEEAVKDIDEKPLAYAAPSLEGEPRFSVDEDFAFVVTYDVYPSLVAPEWKGLEIEVPQAEIAAEDEERELAQIRERNAIVVEKEAEAALGDVVTVDYAEMGPDGSALPGSERKDFTFEIGTGYNIYKFDEEILGMKKGEEKLVEKSYPADFENKDLAGRAIKVRVDLTKVKEKKLPELDDEFAKDISEKYSTLADLKAEIRRQLEKRLADKIRQLKEKSIIEGLLARSDVQLPRSMVEAELGLRIQNLKRQMGIDVDEKLDRLLSYSGKTREALAEEWRPQAEKAIATRIVLDKLTEEGKFECSDADLDAELRRQAEESSLSIDELRAEYEKRGNFEYLRDRIKEDKLMAAIIAAATMKPGVKSRYVDLIRENE
jgi:trigger factor